MRIIITIELPSTAALGTYVKTQYSENVSIESHLKKYFWDFKMSGGIIGRRLTEGCYYIYIGGTTVDIVLTVSSQ